MAKLLRSENINGISRIIYKNPYKVVIIFEKKECANKLIECEKLLNLGYRIYPADEMTLSYGIVKQVDMEEVDEEIIHNLKSDCEIIAVRRLKRLNDKGEWINSETIRLTFKSSTVPSFMYGFGCKFKVEKYIFPVSQCSNCWKFGHLSRSCTIKTPICPKCGDNHNNCETDNFKCVNCKRPHMALYKKCPIFLKEKEIREIMSEKNCNYRNAMKLFAAHKNKQNHIQEEVIEDQRKNFQQSNTLNIQKDGRSYRDVVVEADVHQNMSTEEDEEDHVHQCLESQTNRTMIKSGKKKKAIKKGKDQSHQRQATIAKDIEAQSKENRSSCSRTSENLSKLVAERRLALSRFRKNPIPENLEILKMKIRNAKNAINKAKTLDWESYCSNINESTNVSDMWNRMRWIKGFRLSKSYASQKEKNYLLRNLAPDYVFGKPPEYFSTNTTLEKPFSLQELYNCIKKRDTAAGIDGITYSMIFHLPVPGKKYLLDLYNLIINKGQIPTQWRDILVVAIPKPNSNITSNKNKLRPISLISCFCKVLHAMLTKRFEWFIEKRNLLSRYTSGFRRGHCCQDCLVRLVTQIQIGFSQNHQTVACFLDIENAYNNVLIDKLIIVMDELGFGKKLCQYLWNYLSERHLRIQDDNKNFSYTTRSRIDYCCFLYDNSAKSNLFKLDKIQNQSMRLIGGFIKTTPIHVMESELALQPLFVRRRYLAGKFIQKIKSLKINGIISFLEEFGISHNNSNFWTHKKKPLLYTLYAELQDVPLHTTTKLEMFSFDIWINNINITNNIKFIDTITKAKKDYSRLDLQTISSEMMTKYVHYYKIYTDGSKDFDQAGAAFFDEQIGTGCKFKISANVSIMYLELFAILEALSYVATIDENNIVIFTDSKSSLQHLARCTSTFRGSPIAYEILKLLQHYNCICKNVSLQWIPSHVGITGNEKTDQLAKEDITDGIDISVKPFYADCIYLIREICFELWTECFDERSKEKGIWYKTIQPQPPGISWIDNLRMKRTDVTLMMRLRSGHIPLNRFAHFI
ncbi:unnamed protein product [Euphydryas editha]|uniref:RNase H type-1 domain-containing protein n=1 Tax=Euphydryas editha TaxID=104508 RepID=A0AAU9VF35_EUPED|nr:unnamed protein product [Euphydryas editha]